ncbi:M16 family metallopeptidase [Terriglobus aquaticus]|uniref:M16 family metallopeptidase n=1 Tax=Terriglobus aquaticus TaxID=940139 RepID=A0ABW9KH11_9BACT|nr:pitrilysin family protein [Terriglobus aquaticus]
MIARLLAVTATTLTLSAAALAQSAPQPSAQPTQPPSQHIVTPPPKPYVLPAYERYVAPNGMTILLLEKHEVPLVAVNLVLRSGSVADPVGKEGLASITAALLRRGTASHTAEQFSNAIDSIGMQYGAGVLLDSSQVSTNFLKKDQATALALFTDTVLHPTFPEAEFTKLLAQRQDAVRSAKDNPQAVLGFYYRAFLYGNNPYGRPSSGDENSLKHITREDVLAFYKTNYTPANAILAVSGDFDARAMRSALDAAFAGWQGKAPAPAPLTAMAPLKGRRVLLVDKPDATQSYFAVGNIGINATDPDRGQLDVVNELFGGRFTSLLNTELRIKTGYTYGASSSFSENRVAGPFTIATFTRNATTGPAIDKTLEVLDTARAQGFTSNQLLSAKNTIAGTLPPELETAQAVAATLARNELYGITRDAFNQSLVKTQQTTPDDAKRLLAHDYPDSKDLVLVVVGKAAEIRPAIQKYSPNITERKISDPGF